MKELQNIESTVERFICAMKFYLKRRHLCFFLELLMLTVYKVRKPRVVTLKAVSFWVNLSRFALSKLLFTSASSLLNASFNKAWFAASCVLIKWSLYAVKLDSLASIKLSMGRMTAQWFWGGPNRSRLKSVAVRLENRFGCAAKCCLRRKKVLVIGNRLR